MGINPQQKQIAQAPNGGECPRGLQISSRGEASRISNNPRGALPHLLEYNNDNLLQEDAEALYVRGASMSSRERVALHIRIGEKNILVRTLKALNDGERPEAEGKKKRKAFGYIEKGTKKSKR